MTNTVIDLSHHQGPVDLETAKHSGIQALLHKCTQGTDYADCMYRPRRAISENLGLLFGAYHFGDATDGKEQAAWFLHNAGSPVPSIIALDIEENPIGKSMELAQAYEFISFIKFHTDKYPLLYGGFYLRQLLAGQRDGLLNLCPLWIADYRPTVQPEIIAGWKAWTLWQYTNGQTGNPPHTVPGIGNCDRNTFNGSPEDLKAFWEQIGE
jgi:lysozyme